MLCRSPSVFVQVTCPPAWMVTAAGAKAKFAIWTAAVAGATAAFGPSGPPVAPPPPLPGAVVDASSLAADRISGGTVRVVVGWLVACAAGVGGGANVQVGAAADDVPQAAVVRARPRATV